MTPTWKKAFIWTLVNLPYFPLFAQTAETSMRQDMKIQYAYTILYVNDVSESIAFYVDAFGFEEKFITPEKDYGEINSGPTTIAFASLELGASNFRNGFLESKRSDKPFGIEMAFTTSNVEEVMANALKNGALLLEPTVTKPWGQKVGYLQDNNGFIIEICTPISE